MEANFQGRMYYDLIWAVITRMDKILSRCPFKICVLYCIMDTILKSLDQPRAEKSYFVWEAVSDTSRLNKMLCPFTGAKGIRRV